MFPGSNTVFEEFWRTFSDPSSGIVFCFFYFIKMGSFEDFFEFWKRKKCDGAKSGLYGGFEILEGHLAQPSKNALVHCHDETGPPP